MNYYERHIGDYLKDTAHLSLLEHGIYTRLLDVYYTREGGIPDKDAARLIGARSRDEREALQAVLAEFFELVDGIHIQRRCNREIERYKGKQEKARRSAEARWGASKAQCEGNANASADDDAQDMRTHCEGNAPRARPQTPVTSNQPSSRATGEVPRRASRLPAAWEPSADLALWARQERPDLDPLKTLERFRDYWTAKAGKDGTKLDWDATYRNWVRGEKAQQQGRTNGHSGDIFVGSH